MNSLPQMLTVVEAAQILRVNRTRAYELVNQNVIPHIRLGKQIRIHRDTFLRWIERQDA